MPRRVWRIKYRNLKGGMPRTIIVHAEDRKEAEAKARKYLVHGKYTGPSITEVTK